MTKQKKVMLYLEDYCKVCTVFTGNSGKLIKQIQVLKNKKVILTVQQLPQTRKNLAGHKDHIYKHRYIHRKNNEIRINNG